MKLTPGNYLVINGEQYPVINCWVEMQSNDGRTRWGIVTEPSITPPCETPVGCARKGCGESPAAHIGLLLGHQYEAEEQPVAPADATPVQEKTAVDQPYGLERASATPRMVDGPGCTPAVVESQEQEYPRDNDEETEWRAEY